MKNKLTNCLKLMRIKHYLKNLLIFLPIIFSGNLLNKQKLPIIILGFISFSLIASIIYIINDIKDIEKDRIHPYKKDRPLASGKISLREAIILVFILMIIIIIINYFTFYINGYNLNFVFLELLYLVINIAYSYGLKNIPIIDVVILVSGFVIRVLFGGILVNIEISNYLYLTIMSGSFYMGFGKRRNELIKTQDKSRDVLKKYNKEFLDKFMYVFLVLSIVFFSLWCTDTQIIAEFGKNIIWIIPLFLVILMKYSLNIEGNSFGDPIEVILNDKILMLLVILFILIILGVLYLL